MREVRLVYPLYRITCKVTKVGSSKTVKDSPFRNSTKCKRRNIPNSDKEERPKEPTFSTSKWLVTKTIESKRGNN
jgi:hypothetical protein